MLLTSRFMGTLKLFTTPDIGEVYQSIATPHGKGRIKFQGSLWPAQAWNIPDEQTAELMPHDLVWVIGRVGLTLLVQPYRISAAIEEDPNLISLPPIAAPESASNAVQLMPALAEQGRL
jgi:hypothetical protein